MGCFGTILIVLGFATTLVSMLAHRIARFRRHRDPAVKDTPWLIAMFLGLALIVAGFAVMRYLAPDPMKLPPSDRESPAMQ